jgi:hypothetical protein
VTITREEALSLLRKWQEERRIIQASLTLSEKTSCSVVGRIEHLDSDSVRIDLRSKFHVGVYTGISVDLMAATGFIFEDTRFTAEHEQAAKIAKSYEGFLFVMLPDGLQAQFWATRTGDEIDFAQQG